jgi:hypothetical protein
MAYAYPDGYSFKESRKTPKPRVTEDAGTSGGVEAIRHAEYSLK